jgi:ribosome maturation factor RimP
MLSEQSKEKVRNLASQVAEREGCFIYDVEFQGRILRVFIDKEGGAGIEDCSNVSKGLNLLLDVEDPVPGGAYNLEVSTPGLDRSLKQVWHFEKVQGKKIWVRTSKALEALGVQNTKFKAVKQISEVLASSDQEGVSFIIEDEKVFVPYSAIEKAKLVFEVEDKSNVKSRDQRNKNPKNKRQNK